MRISRRQTLRRSAPWLARLALFALLFQITAVDHHTHVEDVTGVVGTSQHAMHCHGAAAGCASGAIEMPGILTQSTQLPTTRSLALQAGLTDDAIPADADLALSSEPPQYAA